ncbi:MAG TPA: divalent-cation tolerance protein CutA [Vicinamibacterales bacterium]|nr:divalent-cation tolerance protein CutA [Vicinamibacterales bacterium]
MSDLVVALTTLPADFDAPALAQDLVTAGLAACVTILPGVTSVYTWDGVPQVDREQQLVIKTSADAIDALLEVLKARHPYDVPEFIVLPIVNGSEEYLLWVEKSVAPRRES